VPKVEPRRPPLRAVREAQGRGLREVARGAGVDPSYLSRVERGLDGVTVATLHALARELRLDELARLLEPWVAK